MAHVFSLAASAAPVVSVGWTPAATMGLIQNLILGGGGFTFIKIYASHLLAMRKIADERAKQVDDRGDAQNTALSARVTDLETQATARENAWAIERREFDKALSDERRECDRQLSEMRGELREMQVKIDGTVRQLIAFQTSEARAIQLSPAMSRAMGTLDQINKGDSE